MFFKLLTTNRLFDNCNYVREKLSFELKCCFVKENYLYFMEKITQPFEIVLKILNIYTIYN